jgi:hypothetical protein
MGDDDQFLTVQATLVCPHCQLASPCDVTTDVGDSPSASAREAADKYARSVLELVKCPGCGKRGAGAFFRLFALAAFSVLGGCVCLFALIAWFGAGFGGESRGASKLVIILGFGAVVLPLIGILLTRSKWRDSTRRVRFMDAPRQKKRKKKSQPQGG